MITIPRGELIQDLREEAPYLAAHCQTAGWPSTQFLALLQEEAIAAKLALSPQGDHEASLLTLDAVFPSSLLRTEDLEADVSLVVQRGQPPNPISHLESQGRNTLMAIRRCMLTGHIEGTGVVKHNAIITQTALLNVPPNQLDQLLMRLITPTPGLDVRYLLAHEETAVPKPLAGCNIEAVVGAAAFGQAIQLEHNEAGELTSYRAAREEAWWTDDREYSKFVKLHERLFSQALPFNKELVKTLEFAF